MGAQSQLLGLGATVLAAANVAARAKDSLNQKKRSQEYYEYLTNVRKENLELIKAKKESLLSRTESANALTEAKTEAIQGKTQNEKDLAAAKIDALGKKAEIDVSKAKQIDAKTKQIDAKTKEIKAKAKLTTANAKLKDAKAEKITAKNSKTNIEATPEVNALTKVKERFEEVNVGPAVREEKENNLMSKWLSEPAPEYESKDAEPVAPQAQAALTDAEQEKEPDNAIELRQKNPNRVVAGRISGEKYAKWKQEAASEIAAHLPHRTLDYTWKDAKRRWEEFGLSLPVEFGSASVEKNITALHHMGIDRNTQLSIVASAENEGMSVSDLIDIRNGLKAKNPRYAKDIDTAIDHILVSYYPDGEYGEWVEDPENVQRAKDDVQQLIEKIFLGKPTDAENEAKYYEEKYGALEAEYDKKYSVWPDENDPDTWYKPADEDEISANRTASDNGDIIF